MKESSAEKVAVVYENTPALSPGRDAVREGGRQARRQGRVSARPSTPQANDFSNEALGLKQERARRGVALHGADARGQAREPGRRRRLPPDLVRQLDLVGLRPRVQGRAARRLAGARAFSPWLPLSDPRTDTYKQEYREPVHRGRRTISGSSAGAWARSWRKGLEQAGKDLGQNGFRNAMQHLNFAPDLWAPVAFRRRRARGRQRRRRAQADRRPLGPRTRLHRKLLSVLAQVVTGLAAGAAYALVAVGVVLIFKGTKALSIAQGEIGAFGFFFGLRWADRGHPRVGLAPSAVRRRS